MKRIEAERGEAGADTPATPKTPRKRGTKAAGVDDGADGSIKKPRSTKKKAKEVIKEEEAEDGANGTLKAEVEEPKAAEGEQGIDDGVPA
jgi:hypothetical protein